MPTPPNRTIEDRLAEFYATNRWYWPVAVLLFAFALAVAYRATH
jgi:hypothetical protein